VYQLAIESIHASVLSAAESHRVAHDRLEHGPHIRLRLADDPEDVGGGRLAVQ
jgi:hypothetical protein